MLAITWFYRLIFNFKSPYLAIKIATFDFSTSILKRLVQFQELSFPAMAIRNRYNNLIVCKMYMMEIIGNYII